MESVFDRYLVAAKGKRSKALEAKLDRIAANKALSPAIVKRSGNAILAEVGLFDYLQGVMEQSRLEFALVSVMEDGSMATEIDFCKAHSTEYDRMLRVLRFDEPLEEEGEEEGDE